MDFKKWISILHCPICQEDLVYRQTSFTCNGCRKIFPVLFGIPDFRLFSPTILGYPSQEEDIRMASELFDLHEKLSFEALVRTRINLASDYSDQKLPDLYIQWRLDSYTRAMELKQLILDQGLVPKVTENKTLGLDIGCGAGSGLATILEVTDRAVGFDLSISDIILAKSFLKKFYPSRDYFLFAGVAENLPLKSEIFTLVLARDVIEHVENQKLFLQEAYRVMQSGTSFLFNTGSRFLFIEPHTMLLGVGYLPRFFQQIYVRIIRKRQYKVHLPSLWELRRWLNKSPFGVNCRIVSSKCMDSFIQWTSKRSKLAHSILNVLNKLGFSNILNRLLAHLSYYEIIAKK